MTLPSYNALAIFALCLAGVWTVGPWQSGGTPILSLFKDLGWPEHEYVCTHPKYQVRVLSFDPFVAHLQDFISDEESEHLKALAYVATSRDEERNEVADSLEAIRYYSNLESARRRVELRGTKVATV